MSESVTLEMFLDEVASITGLQISLYDLNYFTGDLPKLEVPKRLRVHCSDYCSCIKTQVKAMQKCKETEMLRAKKAAEADGPILHTCHAGITDLVVPLKVGNENFGALYLGQCFTTNPNTSKNNCARIATKYGHDLDELQQKASYIPRLKRSELRRWITLLLCVKDYIEQAEELLEVRKERLAALPVGGDAMVGSMKKQSIETVPNYFLEKIRPHSVPIRKAVDILRNNYWRQVGQAEVARRSGLSPSQFSRRFKIETGYTFRQCLSMARISAAAFLLKRTSLGFAEISDMLGYESSSSLQRAFKRQMNQTPRTFLRQLPPQWTSYY